MIEVFKEIKGFESYKISNLGRVINKDNFELKHRTHSKSGYKQINLWDGKKHHKRYIHRLLAEQFLPNPNNYRTVNHINGCKTDNRLENLEWCSDERQQREAFRLGLKKKTGRYLSDELIFTIYDMYFKEGIYPRKISEKLNLPFGTVRKICYRERCKDLYREYRANVLGNTDTQCNAQNLNLPE